MPPPPTHKCGMTHKLSPQMREGKRGERDERVGERGKGRGDKRRDE